MKYWIILISLLVYSCKGNKNSTKTTNITLSEIQLKYNLNFENEGPAGHIGHLPKGWWKWGNIEHYIIKKDSKEVQDGKLSIKIELESNIKRTSSFGSAVYRIPLKYKGNKIKLTGYIKTSNVKEGHAYFMVNTQKRNDLWEVEITSDKLEGDNEWKKYSVKIPLDPEDDFIYIACKLTGKGIVWFDNFDVFIDRISVNAIE
ncbi:MAG: hypothetical protein ACI920_000290 [Saprospiraceae bacterium]|jgi:hypothetical protein